MQLTHTGRNASNGQQFAYCYYKFGYETTKLNHKTISDDGHTPKIVICREMIKIKTSTNTTINQKYKTEMILTTFLQNGQKHTISILYSMVRFYLHALFGYTHFTR